MVAAEPVAGVEVDGVAAPAVALTAPISEPGSKLLALGAPEMAEREGSGRDAALRTATVHLWVWSGGAASFSAGVRGVDVDPYRIGLWMANPLTLLFDMMTGCYWQTRAKKCESEVGSRVATGSKSRHPQFRFCVSGEKRQSGEAAKSEADIFRSSDPLLSQTKKKVRQIKARNLFGSHRERAADVIRDFQNLDLHIQHQHFLCDHLPTRLVPLRRHTRHTKAQHGVRGSCHCP